MDEMADYSKFHALATRLIAEKGMKMIFLHVTKAGDQFDPDTGKYPVAIEEREVMGVLARPTAKELGAGLFQGLRTVALVAGASLEKADLTDRLRFGGHDYGIREIVNVAPAGETILYKFGLEDMGESQPDEPEDRVPEKDGAEAS